MNKMTKRELKRAKKRAMQSKMENLEPTFGSATITSKKAMTVQKKNGQNVHTYWEKNEVVKDGIDNDTMFHKTMKDSIGEFEFIIEEYDDKNVLVTVGGTHHREHKMSKKHAYWEWDMIWEDIGCPKVLQ
jgi:hypothetical protein